MVPDRALNLVAGTRFALAFLAYEASVILLHYPAVYFRSGGGDSNPSPAVPQTAVLTCYTTTYTW